ncbi:MAG TPA: hypothetical protein VE218_07310 [Acidobacteriaceae bacterium]|nr:hypothetical protein [Acidobacteriaceae bacterium]
MTNSTRRRFLNSAFCAALGLVIVPASFCAQPVDNWRAATPDELKSVIPARAPVISERIETEFRTASGITDGSGHFIAGVVMITAGYSAEGKYSHYFLVQAPMRVGNVALSPGDYVFGWTRSQDALKVSFYQAPTGKEIGQVDAERNPAITRVESFRIWPPHGTGSEPRSIIQIGRFSFPYSLIAR